MLAFSRLIAQALTCNPIFQDFFKNLLRENNNCVNINIVNTKGYSVNGSTSVSKTACEGSSPSTPAIFPKKEPNLF